MIASYVFTSFIRNKKRIFFLTIGIVISVMLLTGVITASKAMGKDMINRNLDTVYVDFTLTTAETNSTKVLSNLELLENEIEGYEGSFASYHFNFVESIISKGPQPIDWDILNFTGENFNSNGNSTHLWGVQGDILEGREQLNKVFSFENQIMNTNQSGIYIDSNSAQIMNITKGDKLNLGTYYQIYDFETDDEDLATAQLNNIEVLGTFNIQDKDAFFKLIQNKEWVYYTSSDIIFMGNDEYIQEIKQNLTEKIEDSVSEKGDTYYSYQEETKFYGIFIDHDTLPVMDIKALKKSLTTMTTRIKLVGKGFNYHVSSQISQKIENIEMELRIYQIIFIMISLPVMLLGWFLCKTNFFLSYHNRRKEIALLKCKGATSSKLILVFLGEAILIGISGGFFGVILGQLTTKWVLQRISPLTTINYTPFISMDLSLWYIGIGLGILISILAVIKPLRDYTNYNPVDGLQSYHEEAQTTLPTKKRDFIFLVIGLIPIVISMLKLDISSNNPLIMALVTLSTALMPIAPFLLTYSLVKILCVSKFVFEKVIFGISKLFGKKYSVLASKNIIQNRTRSFRLLFIVSMALSFLLMASTIQESEIQYQKDVSIMATGNGIRASYYNWGYSGINLTEIGSAVRQNNLSEYIENIAWMFQYQGSTIKDYSSSGGSPNNGYDMDYLGSPVVYGISTENLSKNMEMKDSWFVNQNAQETLTKLKTTNNSAIIPKSLEDEGYKIKDVLEVEYTLANGSIGQKSLTIIDVYEIFPVVSMNSYQPTIIVNNATIGNGKLDSLELIVYPKSKASESQVNYEKIEENLLSYNSNGNVYNPIDYLENSSGMIYAIVNFLDLESYYLLTIVTFAIGFIMYISISEKSRDFGVLRARGVEKKEIYKIQLAEGTILLIFGGIIGFIGILGAFAVVNNLNALNLFSSMKRTFLIPWIKAGIQLLATLVLFILSIGLSVFYETKKSEVGKIADLLRV